MVSTTPFQIHFGGRSSRGHGQGGCSLPSQELGTSAGGEQKKVMHQSRGATIPIKESPRVFYCPLYRLRFPFFRSPPPVYDHRHAFLHDPRCCPRVPLHRPRRNYRSPCVPVPPESHYLTHPAPQRARRSATRPLRPTRTDSTSPTTTTAPGRTPRPRRTPSRASHARAPPKRTSTPRSTMPHPCAPPPYVVGIARTHN